MNDVQALGAVLLDAPEDETLAAALQDAVMEERGYNANEATKHVQAIQAAGWTARAVAHAARILRTDDVLRDQIHERLRRAALLPQGAAFLVILVEGEGRCWTPAAGSLARTRPKTVVTITVGHVWILHHVSIWGAADEKAEALAHLRRYYK